MSTLTGRFSSLTSLLLVIIQDHSKAFRKENTEGSPASKKCLHCRLPGNLFQVFAPMFCTHTVRFPFSSVRHVILPKELTELVPRTHLMTESEWRNLGVQQSPGWIHYLIHEPGKMAFSVFPNKIVKQGTFPPPHPYKKVIF